MADALEPLPSLDTRSLFLPLHQELVALLEGLSAADWERPTVAGAWRVRDVAAHLADNQLRRLSLQRDAHILPVPVEARSGEAGLVAFLNTLNADWVRAAGRLSPRVLLDLLRLAGPAMAELFGSLDLQGPAFFPVAWAGESQSRNWMDVGREYTEQWHHQQQIRLAVGAPPLFEEKWLRPVLEISLRALPHRYREVAAVESEALAVTISGPAGGHYALVRERGAWALYAGTPAAPAARVLLDEDAAFRIFFKAWRETPPPVVLEGRLDLARPFLVAWAVMA
jgi:uncharacterized protein (TIGR03083 family)